MNQLLLYLVTPCLGLLRNYIKYKQCNFKTFIRTPIIYFFFHIILCLYNCNCVIYRTIIYERWFFFIDKSIISLLNNDYQKNREKYIKKYGLKY